MVHQHCFFCPKTEKPRLVPMAVLTYKVHTMPCYWPEVMKCPHHLDIRVVEVFKQNAEVQVVIMNVMQMHNVWLYLLYLTYKLTGSTAKAQSFIVKKDSVRHSEGSYPTYCQLLSIEMTMDCDVWRKPYRFPIHASERTH